MMHLKARYLCCLFVMATLASAARASTDTTFAAPADKLMGWVTGFPGRLVAWALFFGGLAAGITLGSVRLAITGAVGALAVAYGPMLVSSLFAAIA